MSSPGPSVLFADDNQLSLHVACAYLAQFGFRVLPACNAGEALALLSNNSVQAVVTDFDMPEVNGLELARMIKQVQPGLPVFVRSGHIGSVRFNDSDIDGWFTKGDPFSSIVPTLQRCARAGQQSPQASYEVH
ncbi:MAG: domain S-box-containing protein [Acidobacteriales bacterium]|nr:domain S-box-containing protein [Terriglobales bacterium]